MASGIGHHKDREDLMHKYTRLRAAGDVFAGLGLIAALVILVWSPHPSFKEMGVAVAVAVVAVMAQQVTVYLYERNRKQLIKNITNEGTE
jgi:uncharacterized membrane protein YdfJ with MMPL/SSD domain